MARTISLFGMSIHVVDMSAAVQTVLGWCDRACGDTCQYVVTPNVDHAVMFQSNFALRQAYEHASLVVADGAPVVLAAKLLRRALPERVAGSDLAPAIFAEATARWSATHSVSQSKLRVFLLGAAPGVADRAAVEIERKWPGVEVVGTCSPPLGFEREEAENEQILAEIATCQTDLVLVGLGAPKQELWVARHADRLQAKAALVYRRRLIFWRAKKKVSAMDAKTGAGMVASRGQRTKATF